MLVVIEGFNGNGNEINWDKIKRIKFSSRFRNEKSQAVKYLAQKLDINKNDLYEMSLDL